MAINATNNGVQRELIPAGNYIARCYQMIHVGTVEENIQGKVKLLNKVRIGWELPEEKRVFKEENGEQPLVISQEFTLSMNEKANLRKVLASWRGKDFTEEEAKCFDVTKLLGVACMLNVIHKPSKSDATKIYEQIGSVSPLPKSVKCPPQVNKTQKLEYDSFDFALFNSLPDFIKTKMQSSMEFASLQHPEHTSVNDADDAGSAIDDLPF
jgi:hypothetical protein